MDKIKENYQEQFLAFEDFLKIFEKNFTLIEGAKLGQYGSFIPR